jgi:hypothetical protein
VSCQLPAVGAVSESTHGLRLSAGASALAVIMMAYMLVWNLANVNSAKIKIPARVRSVGNLVGLDQNWEMFAPFPAKDDGWYVIPGQLKNHRWRKFFELLNKRSYLATGYASYLCRNWNRSHSGAEALQELEIVFMLEWTRPNFEYFEPRKISLLKYQCAAAAAKGGL